ncbi:hypothetical protein [Clostridium niameyense]|uniref:hypothetical protein n=1 Tax=Clostridium niameyense TaxID=1622073 RepID=UPI000AF146D2|nr:hypothetical protein [Clostridium niameyense]
MIKNKLFKNSFMKNRLVRPHYINCLDKKEKMVLASIIGVSFMRGICVGMYINDK